LNVILDITEISKSKRIITLINMLFDACFQAAHMTRTITMWQIYITLFIRKVIWQRLSGGLQPKRPTLRAKC